MSDSLRPKASNIAQILGVAIPVLVFAGGLVKAYAEIETEVATRALYVSQHETAIAELRKEIDRLKAQAVQAEILQRLTAVETKIDALAEEKKRRR